MGSWNGFLAIIGVGGLVMLLAALADRRARKRAENERPGVDDPDAIPEYVTDDQLARSVRTARSEPETPIPAEAIRLPLRLVDPRFGRGAAGRSTLEMAAVMVCVDAISSMRELLPVLAAVSASHLPLVIAAASVDGLTTDTLVANHLAGKIALQVLGDDSLDGAPLAQLASLSSAKPITAADLKAGDVTAVDLGFVALSVACADPPETYVMIASNS
jgi:hypothetical protein